LKPTDEEARTPETKDVTGTARRSVGPAVDNAYYAQLTTGQTMRNNILVCDANNSIIASKWEIRTQFALHCTVNPLYISHFHCITYYTLARAHTRRTIAIHTYIMRARVCVWVWHSRFLRLYVCHLGEQSSLRVLSAVRFILHILYVVSQSPILNIYICICTLNA